MKLRIGLFSLVITLFIVGTHKYLVGQSDSSDRRSNSSGFNVAQQLQIERRVDETVREYGVVQSSRVIRIRSEVKGEATILHLVPDGSRVKKGDLLIRLDNSMLRDESFQQKQALAGVQASYVQAKSTFAALKQQEPSLSAAVELAVKVAKLAQSKYLAKGGEYELQKRSTEQAIALAEQRLYLFQKILIQIEKKKENDSAQQKELLQAQISVAESRAALATAQANNRFLSEFTRPYQVAVLDLAIKQATSALTQTKSEHKSALEKSKANLQVQSAALELERYRLEQIDRQIEKCTIRAPRDGVVIYDSSTGRRTTTTSAMQEGATVRERQPLLRMPDFSQLELRVTVHETSINRVKIGQPVTIRLDAVPNRTFQGTVKLLNAKPEPASWLSSEVKEYAVLVTIEKPSADMKIGMTAEAEIDVSQKVRIRPSASSGNRRFDLFKYDKNGDGKLSKKEVPEQLKSFFDRIDSNSDGLLDKAEIESVRNRRLRSSQKK